MKRAKRRKFRMHLFDIENKMHEIFRRVSPRLAETVTRDNPLLHALMGSRK